MNLRSILGLLLITSACGGTDISKFSYGAGQPGTKLAEGGEIRFERVNMLGMPPQTWVMVYQYNGRSLAETAPFMAPADGGKGMFGNCADERVAVDWPLAPLTGATFLDLPKVEVTGPGINGTLDVVKTNPPNMVGNSTFRHYDFTYGGGGPGDMTGFNASKTTADMSTPGGEYTLDIGIGDPMTMYIPDQYTTPLGIGTSSTPVPIPAHQDLDLMWTDPTNDFGSSGQEHTRKTHFNLTFFVDPNNMTNPPQFVCFPTDPGHTVVPAAVVDALAPGGLIVNADLAHYMEARDAGGDNRRFDLVSIYCNISLYSVQ